MGQPLRCSEDLNVAKCRIALLRTICMLLIVPCTIKLKIWVVTMQIITNFIHMILKEITLQGLYTGITCNPP